MSIDPYFDLTGKTALVTGGSRGLGYQMVRAFAERGADVVIASRKLDNCERVATEVRELGRRALPLSVHAAKWDSIDQLIAAAYAEFEHIDILVNNAGMSPPMPSHEVTEELFDSVVGLNFKGPFRLASQVGKRMYDGHGGVIINDQHGRQVTWTVGMSLVNKYWGVILGIRGAVHQRIVYRCDERGQIFDDGIQLADIIVQILL